MARVPQITSKTRLPLTNSTSSMRLPAAVGVSRSLFRTAA